MIERRVAVSCLLLALSVFVNSCGDSTAPAPAPIPASVRIVSGEAQDGPVGAELSAPLTARVLDGKGRPMEGELVQFIVTAGGGTLSAPSALTNSDGVVEDRWTLGKSAADSQAVQARIAVDEDVFLVARFHAVARPDAPDTVRVVSGDGQSVFAGTALADSLLALVVDRFGNPVPGVEVAWTVSADGGTLSRSTDKTTTTGYTSAKLVAGNASGDRTIVAAVGGHSATFTVQVTQRPPPLGYHVLQAPRSFFQTSERLWSVSGAIEFLPNGTALLTESASTTDFNSNYRATCPVTGFVGGVPTLYGDSVQFVSWKGAVSTNTITLNGGPVFPFNVERVYGPASSTGLPSAGPATSLAVVSGDGQQAQAGSTVADPLIVRALDPAGQPVAGQVVRFIVTGGGGYASGALTSAGYVITDANGSAQVQWTLGKTTNNTCFVDSDQRMAAIMVSSADGVPPPIARFSATALP